MNKGTLDVMEIGDKTHLICISIFIPSSFVSNKVINIPFRTKLRPSKGEFMYVTVHLFIGKMNNFVRNWPLDRDGSL